MMYSQGPSDVMTYTFPNLTPGCSYRLFIISPTPAGRTLLPPSGHSPRRRPRGRSTDGASTTTVTRDLSADPSTFTYDDADLVYQRSYGTFTMSAGKTRTLTITLSNLAGSGGSTLFADALADHSGLPADGHAG